MMVAHILLRGTTEIRNERGSRSLKEREPPSKQGLARARPVAGGGPQRRIDGGIRHEDPHASEPRVQFVRAKFRVSVCYVTFARLCPGRKRSDGQAQLWQRAETPPGSRRGHGCRDNVTCALRSEALTHHPTLARAVGGP